MSDTESPGSGRRRYHRSTVAGRLGAGLYRLLLHAYPRRFRELYGADMVGYLRQRRATLAARDGRSRAAGFFLLGKDVLVDLLCSVPREHMAAHRARARRAAAPPSPTPAGDPLMYEFFGDIALSIRGLAKRPAFALTVILTLGLGIGANTAVFSLVNGVLLTPLPYPEPDRLIFVMENNSPTNTFPMSVADHQGIQRGQTTLAGFAGLTRRFVTLTGGDAPRQVLMGYVTAQFFDVLQTPPAVGRGFRTGEGVPGAERVIVLSHAFKERHFGAGADPIGDPVILDGLPYTVVGIMPPGVDELAGLTAEAWPIFQPEEPGRRGPFFITGVGRLKGGVTISDAAADLGRVSQELFPVWADSFHDEAARLIPLGMRERIVGNASDSLAIVFGAVAFVLLVALANVANLMMARATDRSLEMAVRSALGAGRGRLARWLIAEGLVLATAGGLLGVAIAFAGVRVFQGASFGLPRLQEVAVDGWALAFTVAIVGISGLFFGVVPLLFGATAQPADSLRTTARGASASGRAALFRNVLVAGEFALTLPLLAAAGLLGATLLQLNAVDPGFDPQGVVTLRIGLPSATYPDNDDRQRFWDEVVAATREVPGVAEVAVTSGLPPDSTWATNNFNLLDRPVEQGQPEPVSPWNFVTPDFFPALGVPVLEGRGFDPAVDTADGAPVVVVSRTWADRYFSGGTAVGKRFISGGCTSCDPTTVVGVVGDVKFQGLAGDGEAVYAPTAQYLPTGMHLVSRSEASPDATLQEIRRRVRAIDPDLPLDDAATMDALLHDSLAEPRHWATLLSVFAAAALTLAAVGIFGVLSYFVRRQHLEIGVRMALGASPASVLALVVRRGIVQAGAGIAAGIVIALLTMRWLESRLFGVTATDPLTLGGVAALLLLVAGLACYLPGRRATRIDPVGAISRR